MLHNMHEFGNEYFLIFLGIFVLLANLVWFLCGRYIESHSKRQYFFGELRIVVFIILLWLPFFLRSFPF